MTTRKTLAIAISLGLAAWGSSAIAATDGEIQTAIDNGLGYLSSTQSGSFWDYGNYDQAATGAAAYAMMTQYSHWGDINPGNVAAYQTQVTNAVNYLLNGATKTTVTTNSAGVNICPGGSGSCAGVYWGAGTGEETYTTGLVAPAIVEYATRFGGGAGAVATTSGPLANMTWGQIAQAINNEWSSGQNALNNICKGGWRYFPGQGGGGAGTSDMSTTQWAIISFLYTGTLGATLPADVKTNLAAWLANPQVQLASGVGCYGPANTSVCDHADTGALLLGLKFLGKSTSDPAVQAALNWLNSNWGQTANNTWFGNFGHPYAMWSVYKGLELNIGVADDTWITNLLGGNCGGDRGTDCNWWQDYNQWLVANQAVGGSFPGYINGYWSNPLATAFYLPILGGTALPPVETTPEPGTLALIALGLAGAASLHRRKSP